jgi:hypothetical protein
MFQKGQKFILAVALVAAVAVGSAVIANAASSGGTTTNGASGATGQQGSRPGGPGQGETALTGEAADKVTAAAKDKVPGGAILRVETDSGSAAYEAHVRKSDGTEVVVLFNSDFEVTGVQEFNGRGPGGGRPPCRGDGSSGGSDSGSSGSSSGSSSSAGQI